MNLEIRTSQVLEVTQQDRNNLNESNPIIFAESAPNRFYIFTYFFPENDGVRVQEDLDLNSIEIYYFNDNKEIQLTDGALHDWALNLYKENN